MRDLARGVGVRVLSSVKRAVVIAVGAWLAGCGGGGGGGVSVGAGQGPDPVVLDIAIAYVRRPLPLDGQGALADGDVRLLRRFDIGADLWLRDRASPSAAARNLTGSLTQGRYDVRDVEASFDGRRLVFAMRGPFIDGADEDEQPTWNLWEYDRDTDSLRRVIASDVTAEAGHDLAPHYLPDGRIVFASTRQREAGAILLDEGKAQFPGLDEDRNEPAFVLHVMDADGTRIRQISFNQSHDLDPVVLASGEIAFTRWDNAGSVDEMSLYRMNPDGSNLELLYGAASHDTGTAGATVQFLQPRPMADGRVLALLRPFSGNLLGGNLVAIDVAHYVDNIQPLAAGSGTLTGPAQVAATVNVATTDGSISAQGLFASAYPLADGTNRLLVSWSQCRVQSDPAALPMPCTAERLADPAAQPAAPIYGIWIYDPAGTTQLPVVPPEEGLMFTDVVALEPRVAPPVIVDLDASGQADAQLLAEGVGLLRIRSVYDIDGVATADIAALADPAQTTADERPARFLRVEKAVAIPDEDVYDFDASAFGASAGQGMREILGYAMVEPDGSVAVKVPANVPLALSVLDRQGRRLGARHQNWLQLRPGEVRECTGCHDPQSALSHGRDASFASAWPGAAVDGQPFPNTTPAIFADAGETMAEARARLSCATDCAAITPAVDPGYEDVWTDPAAAGRAADAPFAWRYADLATPAPVGAQCQAAWSPACRIVINYETHVHPLWGRSRQVLGGGGAVIADHTCTGCHAGTDAGGGAQVPAAQLDLADGASDTRPAYFKSYAELMFGDNEQELAGGVLRDRLVQVGVDPDTGDPIYAPVPVSPPLSTAGALASPRFFDRFAAGGSHAGYLSGAELRLVAEWLDIGGQYFNNPFDAPAD